jgi:integrase
MVIGGVIAWFGKGELVAAGREVWRGHLWMRRLAAAAVHARFHVVSVKVPERQIASPQQVSELLEKITPRYRAAVVLAAWCGLRRGEVCAIRTADVDLDAGLVRVAKKLGRASGVAREV